MSVEKTCSFSVILNSPGLLSILITVLRHNMAAIAEIGGFCIHFTLFVFCSELVGLSSQNSIRYGQQSKNSSPLSKMAVAEWVERLEMLTVKWDSA